MKAKEEKTQHHKINIMKPRNFNFYKVKEKHIRQKEDRIFTKKGIYKGKTKKKQKNKSPECNDINPILSKRE